MKILGYEIRKASKREIREVVASGYTGNSLFLGSRENAMLLSTVYRCVDVISDSVAQLPLETFSIDTEGFKRPFINHPIYSLMNDEPNEDMTRFTFFKTMVASILLRGNAYAYIERDFRGNTVQLIYLQDHQVSIEWILDTDGVKRKRYRIVGFKELVEPKDMIHFLNFSYDGIIGVSTLTHARQSLGIATDSEAHAAKFFKGGANMAGIMTIEGTRVNTDQKQQNYDEWSKRTDPITGNSNGIVILEGNMKYQPISINPRDSQLLESRKFNVVDVCRFFSVSPVKAFDLTEANYSTVEATQLAFLTDTVAPILVKIELELQRKLFKNSEKGKVRIEFNTSGFLRADKAAQGTYLNAMFQIGAMTPNEIRRENNLPKVEYGDNAFVQVNIQTLERASKNNDIEIQKNVKK
ncbi:MAG: phage portal protein [Dysgonomonas sp.]|uniref:phage portal protein n=1 Tax=Dysgonomonas sp. TaxID=1891233 RepID=UPI0039E6019C